MAIFLPSPLAGEGGMRSMTDEGSREALLSALIGSLRDTPHPTFANAKATFSRKGRRLGLAFAALLLTPAAAAASACSCMALAPESIRQTTSTIIEGRVTGIKREGGINGRLIARIAVTKQVKGKTPRTVTVTTRGNSAACGYNFVAGQSGEFLLSRDRGRYETNLCLMMGARR